MSHLNWLVESLHWSIEIEGHKENRENASANQMRGLGTVGLNNVGEWYGYRQQMMGCLPGPALFGFKALASATKGISHVWYVKWSLFAKKNLEICVNFHDESNDSN